MIILIKERLNPKNVKTLIDLHPRLAETPGCWNPEYLLTIFIYIYYLCDNFKWPLTLKIKQLDIPANRSFSKPTANFIIWSIYLYMERGLRWGSMMGNILCPVGLPFSSSLSSYTRSTLSIENNLVPKFLKWAQWRDVMVRYLIKIYISIRNPNSFVSWKILKNE